jgi:hypothetical protein
MKSRFSCCLLFLIPLVVAAGAAEVTDNKPVVNPQVVAKLLDMGEHLRSLPRFQVEAEVDRDIVLDDGQKLKMHSVNTLQVEGRNRLFARSDGDVRTREFYYNGKKLTQYSPFLKFYTTVDAPDTLGEMLHQVEQYYGVQLPMEDLFLFGSDQTQIDALTGAAYVGPSSIRGKLCDHLAFRQEHVDWQLWITREEKPLPCKLVITTTDDPSFPEYTAVYAWKLSATFKPSVFTFVPAKGDVSIPLKKAGEGTQ